MITGRHQHKSDQEKENGNKNRKMEDGRKGKGQRGRFMRSFPLSHVSLVLFALLVYRLNSQDWSQPLPSQGRVSH